MIASARTIERVSFREKDGGIGDAMEGCNTYGKR